MTYPETGTPQGGVVSPLLANVFLHHAFDLWMEETYPYVPFERYADDIVGVGGDPGSYPAAGAQGSTAAFRAVC